MRGGEGLVMVHVSFLKPSEGAASSDVNLVLKTTAGCEDSSCMGAL